MICITRHALRARALLDALALAGLGLYCAALLRNTLVRGGAMVGYDLFTYFYPAKTFAARALAQGQLPLWNPDIYFGVPFLANVQMAALYPPDALFLWLSFPRAVAWSQWLHLLIAGGGMYALCRWGWGLDVVGALVGGLAFAGSGFFGAHMGHLNQVHAGAWLPLLVLCWLRLAAALGAARRRMGAIIRWLVAGGAVVALQVTAGHTQETYYSLFSAALLALGYTVFPTARVPRRWPYLPALAAIVANGALLAAVQLVPALELTRLSYRQGGIPIDEAVAYAVERTNVLETVLPTFWSLPSQEVTGFVGVVALPLVVAAIGASPARRTVLSLLALALLALTLTLGTYTALYWYLYRFVPLFNAFRAPGRWLLIWTFALAGLAAHGAAALRYRGHGPARERVVAGFAASLAALAAAIAFFAWRSAFVHAIQWLPLARVAILWLLAAVASISFGLLSALSKSGWPRLVIVASLALELGFAAREMEYNQPSLASLYTDPPAVAGYLQHALAEPAPDGGPVRVLSLAVEERLDPQRLEAAVPEGDPTFRHYASMREALKPDLGMVYGLPTIDGYDGGLLPTRAYAQFKELLVTAEPPVPHFTLPPQMNGQADASLFSALGVRYLVVDGRSGAPGPGWTRRDEAPGAAWVYENERVLPRAFIVSEVVRADGPEEAFQRLRGLNLGQAAVVDDAAFPANVLSAAAPSQAGTLAPGPAQSARVVRYSPAEIEVEVEVDRPGLLVMTDSYYPGWRASIDGQATTIWPADLLFRSVLVPPGRHQVRMWYEPLSVRAGGMLSLLALAANGAALWLGRRERGQAAAADHGQ